MTLQKPYGSPSSRAYHGSCVVDGKFWIYGGILLPKGGSYLSDCWVYKIDQGEWEKVTFGNIKRFQPHPLAYHTMTPVFTKKVTNSDGSLKSFTASRFDKMNVIPFCDHRKTEP